MSIAKGSFVSKIGVPEKKFGKLVLIAIVGYLAYKVT